MREKIVIVGGGFGGLYAARELKNVPVQVTLIDRRNHHLFQPLLYQVATGALSPADIATPLRGLLKNQKNARVLLGEVMDFDTANKRVILADDVVDYDTLIVAAGSGKQYFGNDAWESLAPGLKSIEDATEIRRRILTAFEAAERTHDPEKRHMWLTFAIIGGGATGVEMAGALAEIARDTLKNEFRTIQSSDARIILIQSQDRVLPNYHPELSAKAASALEKLGVEIITGARVTEMPSRGVVISREEHQEYIPARTVLWTAGVQASPLGQALARSTGVPLDSGGRVVVEPDLSLPGHPDIFVIGDLAHFAHQTGSPLPGVAQVAIQQGCYVGDVIKRCQTGKTIKPFHYQDRGNMATIGRGAAVAEAGRFRLTGWLAWELWLFIHLLYLKGVENRMLVFLQWLWNYVTRKRTALLITNRDGDTSDSQVLNSGIKLITSTGTYPQVNHSPEGDWSQAV